jgi:hypothetical protein
MMCKSSAENVSKVYATSIFRVEVCNVILCIYRFRLKKQRQGKMGIGAA